jgi:hypothetical protein
MAKKQDSGPKHAERSLPQDKAAADKRRHQVKTPDHGGEHPPGMGEDENETYVPEKQRP